MHAISQRDALRWRAVRSRDAAQDGSFFYAVATTGVYCYPSCASRPARRDNVSFYDAREAAEKAGFRPCLRCRPDLPPRAEREAAMADCARRRIERSGTEPSLTMLAREAGLSPHHFHRIFRRIVGMTPKAYARAARGARLREALDAGASVTRAIHEAGFQSTSRVHAASREALGMTPKTYRAGGAGERISWAVRPSAALGGILVAATGNGVCAVLLGDEPEAMRAELEGRFPRAALVEGDAAFGSLVDQVVARVEASGPAAGLPLDMHGTLFQRRVWAALQEVPRGETTTYSEIARKIGHPSAVRAVAGACAANPVGVLVPCHRVLRSDGTLSGYYWGVARKRALLTREQGE